MIVKTKDCEGREIEVRSLYKPRKIQVGDKKYLYKYIIQVKWYNEKKFSENGNIIFKTKKEVMKYMKGKKLDNIVASGIAAKNVTGYF